MIKIPNEKHGRRREASDIDLLIIHSHAEWVIDTQDDGGKGRGFVWHCTDWLRAIGLSCHAWCLPDGRIVREVDSWNIAYHARGFNDRSIGMEFVVAGVLSYAEFLNAMDQPPDAGLYSDAQYESGAGWYAARIREHGLSVSQIDTHMGIDPERKHDPGRAFDLPRFLQMVREG